MLRKVILYRQRMTAMDSNWISLKINQEELKRRKNTWNLQFKMWFEEWGIVEECSPVDRKELRVHLQDCSRKGKWRKYLKRKQQYQVENFNSKEEIRDQDVV